MWQIRYCPNLRHWVLWLLLLTVSSANSYAREQPIMVVINEDDCKTLGGWPLDRKWYAVALQNLSANGATRIFLDLAFPNADVAHPESDEFFFHTLQTLPNIYLLTEELHTDSVRILGGKTFPAKRCFLPFSEGFTIKNEKIIAKAGAVRTLASFFYDVPLTQTLAIVLPTQKLTPTYSLREVIQGGGEVKGRDVVIYLDYAGVSSYVVSERSGEAFSTAELEIWVALKVAAGEVLTVWENWQIGALLMLSLLPLAYYTRRTSSLHAALGAIGLNILGFVGLHIAKVDVPVLWLSANALPIAIIAGLLVVRSRRALVRTLVAKNTEKVQQRLSSVQDAAYSSNGEELRYRLQFYERLSHNVPVSLPKTFPEAEDIYFAANSPLAAILAKADQVAKHDIPVLILGESGVGKEKLAQFIHRRSERRDKPFIAINCGALNENLIESELFGYEAGAFTGAVKTKIGRFEQAMVARYFLTKSERPA
jgi:Transcriptional regulator containing PAS, AAA-type ATPase, and DNA-binding domains